MLSAQHVITSVQAHWVEQFLPDVPTNFPGMRLDASRLEAWCELWVDAWAAEPRRSFAADVLSVGVTVHCFAQGMARKTEAHRLADAARNALAGRLITICDSTPAVPAPIGVLRLFEHAVRDLSRNHSALGQERLQHLVLTLPGQAQQTT